MPLKGSVPLQPFHFALVDIHPNTHAFPWKIAHFGK